MLVTCHVLKQFHFSEDGVNTKPALVGREAHVPHDLVPGLEREGYVRAKAIGAAPENKAIQSAPEDKRTVTRGPKGLWFVTDGSTRVGRGYQTEQEAREAI